MCVLRFLSLYMKHTRSPDIKAIKSIYDSSNQNKHENFFKSQISFIKLYLIVYLIHCFRNAQTIQYRETSLGGQ